MCAKFAYDSPSRRPIPRFRFSRNVKHMDMEDAKVAFDLIIRPSFQLWKLALARSALTTLKRPQKTAIFCDDTSSTSSTTTKVSLVRCLESRHESDCMSRREFASMNSPSQSLVGASLKDVGRIPVRLLLHALVSSFVYVAFSLVATSTIQSNTVTGRRVSYTSRASA